MRQIRVIGALDPNFAWDGSALYRDADVRVGTEPPYELRGAAAFVQRREGEGLRILRDPLGLNKLFWVSDAGGTVHLASRPRRLVEEGHAFERIRAIPRGCVLDIVPDASKSKEHSIIPDAWSPRSRVEKLGAEAIAARIRAGLDRYMAAIATNYPDAQVFVCLSGGLDSSGVAALATQHFSEVTAVSFDLRRPAQRASEDRVAAERVAHDLGLSLLEATVSEEELFDHLDTVLVEGIDWRDFNVHAALVNAVLAARIEQAVPAHARASALVMTGDLPNEFLVDYRPETYRGTSYYGMPRLKPSALRDILVRGLDTSHREIGVFAAFGLPVVQPYAVAVDDYLALPGELLALEDRKEQLCRKIFGDLLPEYVYSRPKVRAQAGSTDVGGGVLAACVDRGFDQIWLRRRFAALHGVTDPAMLDDFIRAGRYRAAVPK